MNLLTLILITLHAGLIACNIFAARVDSLLIKGNIAISHKTNLIYYSALVLLLCVPAFFAFGIVGAGLFALSTFFCRQVFFDVALNLFRGLPWDYLPAPGANAAWWDGIEYRVVGKKYNGLLTAAYLVIYITLIIVTL